MRKWQEESIEDSCWSKARGDELMFILLGRDRASPQTIRHWAHKRIELGLNEPEDDQIRYALEMADEIEKELAIPPDRPTTIPELMDQLEEILATASAMKIPMGIVWARPNEQQVIETIQNLPLDQVVHLFKTAASNIKREYLDA